MVIRGVPARVVAVLFDRDGTLVHDVPYNGNPAAVRIIDGAATAVQRVRRAGLATGVVTNQSAIGRGLLTAAAVAAVDRRVDELLGPFGTWQVCPHAPRDGCPCRKPRSGLVVRAARTLAVPVTAVVVVGDTGADVAAAEAVGARGILVPNAVTAGVEVRSARYVADDLGAAVDLVLRSWT